jgi:catechol 2,3-dioxygenase-like lactoylglutathione lyase family enzyme
MEMGSEIIVKLMTHEIPVKDIKESAAWYVKHLGFELVPPAKGVAELKLASGARICLFRPDHDNEESYWYVREDSNYRVRVCLRVADIETLHKDLKEAGVRVGEMEGGSGCGRTFEFHDVNGNKLVAWSGYTKDHDWYYE